MSLTCDVYDVQQYLLFLHLSSRYEVLNNGFVLQLIKNVFDLTWQQNAGRSLMLLLYVLT